MIERLTPMALAFVACLCWGFVASAMGVPFWQSALQSLMMGMAIGQGVQR